MTVLRISPLALLLIARTGLSDEKAVKVRAVPARAIAIDLAVPVAVEVKAEAVEAKPAQAKVEGVVEVEEFAAPVVRMLEEKIDLKAADAQLQQFIPQFNEQYRPMLTVELNFIRQTCELPVAQRPKVRKAGEAALADVCKKMAENQLRHMVPGGGAVQAVTPPDPRQTIRSALKKALQETLTPEAFAKYSAELDQRSATRKHAAITSVVARLDGAMCLTVEQREKIEASINAAWQDRWEQWLYLNIYGDQYFPIMPDEAVVSHLNQDQKSIWSGLQKVDFGFWGGNGIAEDNDGWWGGDAPKAAKPQVFRFGF
jgi:hypothetical protein